MKTRTWEPKYSRRASSKPASMLVWLSVATASASTVQSSAVGPTPPQVITMSLSFLTALISLQPFRSNGLYRCSLLSTATLLWRLTKNRQY